MTKTKEVFILSSRYTVLGKPPKNYCKGPCEGTGIVPVGPKVKDKALRKLYLEAKSKRQSEDGYYFVKCPVCKGSRVNPKRTKG